MYNFIAKLLNFIESSTDHTNSEIVIAEYILRNVHQLPGMSIYQVAEACHTSPATVSRFCKKFDNISFKELKEYARTYTEFNESEVDYEKVEASINEDLIEDYFDNVAESIKETAALLQSKELLNIAKKIHLAKKISIFGVTFSHLLARNTQFKFLRLGKYATAYGNHENQLTEAESLNSNDLAIVVSFSGETRFITRLVKKLRERNIPIAAITSNPDSFLAKNAEEILLLSNRRIEGYKSPIIEEVSMLTVINSIYLFYSAFISSIEN
ncbi:MurR/RpiR family transcriptional regulator [Mesobacillus subterraneus]|uniref:MurR/RpiR family transcriptional regulator n=1 Tax=Mesobacillus subterraneus TaxID=285983 RepID=UPI00204009F0|nr:MurR/RpiR family transcriptional regulator [Mesobacillus subterraneus]MCM3576248.1 MurR/RpiR family transcriptional regulator [Mesobacillus subterraneus]